MKIKEIKSLKQLSSMGNETIRVILRLDNDIVSSVGVPSGISAGKYEAQSIPADEALTQIESARNSLVTGDWEQNSLDEQLRKLSMSGNASVAISAAFWKATEITNQETHYQNFPKLCMLLFEGGKHGNSNITVQEFMLIEDSLTQAIQDFKKLRQYLTIQKIETTVGAEGGFSPVNFNNEKVLEVIKTVFPEAPLALDVAGSFNENEEEYDKLFSNNNIFYLEDPYSDEAWEKWSSLFQKYQKVKLVVGDDLTVTNPKRIEQAIQKNAINAVIIKPNQNGTISGTLEAVKLAREHGLKVIVSHRGEETNDDWIVDFALSLKADYVKFGGIDRGERIAKYNRLMELGMR